MLRGENGAVNGIGRLRRRALADAQCLPWIGRLVAGDLEQAAQDLARGVPDVARLQRFVATHRLEPLLSQRIEHPALRRLLPAELRSSWQDRYLRQWLANSSVTRQLPRLWHALSQCCEGPILLKGPAHAALYYGDLAQRRFEDLDLLVPAQHATNCLHRLQRELGSRQPLLGQALVRRATHARALRGAEVQIDLHWALRCHPSFRIDPARIWSTRLELTLPEPDLTIAVLSHEYSLVLSLLEIFDDLSRLEHSVKGLLDCLLILHAANRSLDWPEFFSRRHAEGLGLISLDTLVMVLELFGARDLFPELEAALTAEGATESWARRIILHDSNRLRALWSYRLPLYEMSRPLALLHLAVSAPVRTVLV